MRRAIRAFQIKAAKYDAVLIYYAGHGLEISGVNYLVPVDAGLERMEYVEDECINANSLLNFQSGSSENSLKIMILDACRNNSQRYPIHK